MSSNEISSLYPPPPPYIKFFTDENVELARERTTKDKADSNRDEDKLESELDFLVPPPMPANDHYRAFGNVWQVKDSLPDLESMGLIQLYTSPKDFEGGTYQYKIQELRRLLKSLLLNYLELVGILSYNPQLYENKVEHIRVILVNIHHLLNAYRPHQSRESLIMLLEGQLEYKQNEIRNIESVCASVQSRLDEIQKSLS